MESSWDSANECSCEGACGKTATGFSRVRPAHEKLFGKPIAETLAAAVVPTGDLDNFVLRFRP